jgi:hypothetical protein
MRSISMKKEIPLTSTLAGLIPGITLLAACGGHTNHRELNMHKDTYFVDRDEFSYYFDSGNNRFVTLSNGYTATVYTFIGGIV